MPRVSGRAPSRPSRATRSAPPRGLPGVRLGVAYRLDGELVDRWPLSLAELERVEPVFETFPGWDEDLGGVRRLADLPAAARAFIDTLEARAGVAVAR